ncbi:MAG: putative porin, partial [Methylococcales bacterium]|nr:putative porin [Methylococcales bacterium]
KDKASQLVKAAEAKAQATTKQELAKEATQVAEDSAKNPKRVRVTYVPDFVKEEIRQQVISDLKGEVVAEVKADAKEEAWGVPAALPDWVNRIKITGDARLRAQEDFFASYNPNQNVLNNPYYDYLSINKDGGHLAARGKNEELQNTSADRLRFRERFRLGIDAQVTDELKAGVRLSTTNQLSPVSSNQTLGNTGQAFQVAIDRAYIQYDFLDKNKTDWFSVYAGRIANPWMSTDLMYSPDLSFEGVAGTFRLRFNQSDVNVKNYHAADNSARFGLYTAPQTPDSLFVTLGAFPLQESNFSTADKWLFGGQVGADWLVRSNDRLKIAAAYYDYENVNARSNKRNSFTNDWTAPQFMQKGNSLVPINVNDGFNSRCTDSQSATGQACLYGLASEFKIFNATAMYDFSGFGDTHVLVTADYAKNLGFDQNRIAREFKQNITPKTNAYQVRLDVGDVEIHKFNDWSTFIAYRYLERDAVLDAYTDSIFHQGGTNAKGWILGANYGIAKNTWLNLRWFSTESIEETNRQPLSIDTVTLDLNVRL